MTITLHLTPTTAIGLAHLRTQIHDIHRADPLQPVHLLLPSMRAIRALRRDLGTSLGVELGQFVLSLTEPLTIAMENGALRALVPLANKAQFVSLPEEIVEKVDLVFYGDVERAVEKALE